MDEGIGFRYAPKRYALRAPLGLRSSRRPHPFREERKQQTETAFRKTQLQNLTHTTAKRDINLINTPPLKTRRRELRNNPTPAETILWKYLQRRQILGKKFRRQYSIGRYIVDFFCVECDIAIELDGAPHFGDLGVERDG